MTSIIDNYYRGGLYVYYTRIEKKARAVHCALPKTVTFLESSSTCACCAYTQPAHYLLNGALKQTCLSKEGAICVQRFDGSQSSAIHTTYRISLHFSSMREPIDLLLKVCFNSAHQLSS